MKNSVVVITNNKVTYSWFEGTAITRRIIDSREMTRSSDDVHFIVVSIAQSQTTAYTIPVYWSIYSLLTNHAVNITSNCGLEQIMLL